MFHCLTGHVYSSNLQSILNQFIYLQSRGFIEGSELVSGGNIFSTVIDRFACVYYFYDSSPVILWFFFCVLPVKSLSRLSVERQPIWLVRFKIKYFSVLNNLLYYISLVYTKKDLRSLKKCLNLVYTNSNILT